MRFCGGKECARKPEFNPDRPPPGYRRDGQVSHGWSFGTNRRSPRSRQRGRDLVGVRRRHRQVHSSPAARPARSTMPMAIPHTSQGEYGYRVHPATDWSHARASMKSLNPFLDELTAEQRCLRISIRATVRSEKGRNYLFPGQHSGAPARTTSKRAKICSGEILKSRLRPPPRRRSLSCLTLAAMRRAQLTRFRARGLAAITAPTGFYIAYAAGLFERVCAR